MEEPESSFRTSPCPDPATPGSTRVTHPDEVITPELALVDPAAAAAARAALPDRPWEIALDRALAESPLPTPPGAVSTASPGRVAAPDDPGPAPSPPDPRVGSAAARRLVFMVAWAAMITVIALLAEVQRPDVPALGADTVSVPERQTDLPTPIPGAGYVMAGGGGFRIGPQGRAIGSLTLPVKCLGNVPLGRVAIGAGKTFSFRGAVRGTHGQPVRVWLEGRFTGPRSAVGSVAVRGQGCVRHPVAFVARVS